MKKSDIINISDIRMFKKSDFIRKFFYTGVLATVFRESNELRLDSEKKVNSWRAGIKEYNSEQDFTYLPFLDIDFINFDVNNLFSYIRSISYNAHNIRGMGLLDGFTSFQINNEIVFGVFRFGEDAQSKWVTLRLLYGESAPIEASKVLEVIRWRKLLKR